MLTSVSLALSGGGMRGCAHIGVLRRLEELHIQPKYISGTSIGAIIGVLFADGYNSREIEDIFLKSKFGFDFNYFRFSESLLSSKRIEAILKKYLRSKHFDALKIPLSVCATDYETGHAAYFKEGKLLPVVMASSAIPLLYKPVKLNDKLYIDGGVSRNLPTIPLKEKGLPIVGVHVNPLLPAKKKTMFQKIDHSMHLLLLEKTREAAVDCKVYIEPEKLSTYSMFETKNIKKIIEIGYIKAKACLTPDLVLGFGRNGL
ncbi:MAG: patatin-like phospholipase family protein [Bacteroidia bacterium]|jgi:NTE family protein|nr:patatin-like phospholipase family protein [Bacteroidia bacterium]